MRRFSLWAPAVVYMALIFHSSSLSDPAPVVTSLIWDKLLHTAGYALLAILFCRALQGEQLALRAGATIAILLTSLYGASDEWHQSFTPLRTADVTDWVADSIGAIAGATLYAGVALNTASRRLRRLPR